MKIFFRKHGNSLFYFLLPLLFLGLTVAFIQFTPRTSQTAPNDQCEFDDQCCTTSGCGPQEISEICEDDTCKRINVGCPEGIVDDDGVECVCVDNEGTVIGECVFCDIGEVFIPDGDGGFECAPICGPDEDPDVTGCVPLGAFLEGTGIGCSLSTAASSAPALPAMLMGLSMLGAAFVARKRSR